MGSDLYLNPPPPPPIDEQVKALVNRNKEMSETIRRLNEDNARLMRQLNKNDQVIANLMREQLS